MNSKYDAILYRQRSYTPRHPPISNRERAAQFAAFAALSGYNDAVDEAGRRTDAMVELAGDAVEELNRALQQVAAQLPQRPTVTLTYFLPDRRKAGGVYRTVTGRAVRLDAGTGELTLESGARIPLGQIYALRCESDDV